MNRTETLQAVSPAAEIPAARKLRKVLLATGVGHFV